MQMRCDMKMKKWICVLLAMTAVFAAGCNRQRTSSGDIVIYNSENPAPEATEETYEEIKVFMGESATLGNMTLTVSTVEDPGIEMESGKMAVFFNVTIENGSDDTVVANYLNNFTITVDGAYYEASECCTIPVMKELYDFYGFPAMAEEIPTGETRTGYIACEVAKGFDELELHYLPKTTDRGSMITVPLSAEDMTKVEK